MDSYDEIFDFLKTAPDQRIACLKHLLNSTRAKLNDATKGKIYGRVCDFDSARTVAVTAHAASPPPSPPQSDSGSVKGSSNSKVRPAAKKKMLEFNITSEELISAGITGTGKGGYIVLADLDALVEQKKVEDA